MSRRRLTEPFEAEITDVDARGNAVGTAPDGRAFIVRPAAPGTRLRLQPAGRHERGWRARRLALIRPAAGGAEPRCAVFGLCGGCTLQELTVEAQRGLKHAAAVRATGGAPREHAMRGAGAWQRDAGGAWGRTGDGAWGYRNKVELSFGTRRYLPDDAHAAGEAIEGRFLGFHAPGRFDRVVDAERCELVSDAANEVIALVRAMTLHPDAPPPYDAREKVGFWRHLLLREAPTTGELWVALFTTSSDGDPVGPLAEALLASAPAGRRVVGVAWVVHDGVADVAQGDTARVWGRSTLHEALGPVPLHISRETFFQTNTAGAFTLYDTIGEALGRGGTLLDLYCGAGTIGLYLADRFDDLVGVEISAAAVDDARAIAARMERPGTWHAGPLEANLEVLNGRARPLRVVVDPPRAGLHPAAARALADLDADVLVYVACNPASLGRDRITLEAGGWRLTDLWTVDLFPHTHHVEAVARFTREGR